MTEIVNLNGFDIRFEIHGEGIPIVYIPGRFLSARTRPIDG